MRVFIVNYGKYLDGEVLGKWVCMPLTTGELQKVYVDIQTATINNHAYVDYYVDTDSNMVYEERAILKYEELPIELIGHINPEHMNLLAEIWSKSDESQRKEKLKYIERNKIKPKVMECINIFLQDEIIDLDKYSFHEAITRIKQYGKIYR